MILGYGEVGQSLARFYAKPFIKDLKQSNIQDGKKIDILNVCLPANSGFLKIVSKNIKIHKPKLAIIHSTVVPGTTLGLYKKFKNIVHSPIRGMHPNLSDGIKKFVKYIGADNKKIGEQAARHFKSIGIKKVKVFTPSLITELGKLADTTYYGLCIAFHAYFKKLCGSLDIDFSKAITDFNSTYNDGYAELGKINVIRPVLYSPLKDIIGGHCVIPNAQILKKYFGDDEILKVILRHERKPRKN